MKITCLQFSCVDVGKRTLARWQPTAAVVCKTMTVSNVLCEL